MSKKIELTTLENYLFEVEPSEIKLIQEEFYVGTNQLYSVITLKSKDDENPDSDRIYKVYETKAEIERRTRLSKV